MVFADTGLDYKFYGVGGLCLAGETQRAARVEQNTNSSERAQVAFNQSQTTFVMFDE